jgi:DNA-binding response OmpR family regulator
MTRILVVDDDAGLRSVLTHLFTQSGYEVRTADDGDDVLRCMEESLPDVLLIDIFMPTQEGIETIRQVHQAFPQVPIIAISGGTGYQGPDVALTAARDFGVRYTFTKPFDTKELLAAVRTLLRG